MTQLRVGAAPHAAIASTNICPAPQPMRENVEGVAPGGDVTNDGRVLRRASGLGEIHDGALLAGATIALGLLGVELEAEAPDERGRDAADRARVPLRLRPRVGVGQAADVGDELAV